MRLLGGRRKPTGAPDHRFVDDDVSRLTKTTVSVSSTRRPSDSSSRNRSRSSSRQPHSSKRSSHSSPRDSSSRSVRSSTSRSTSRGRSLDRQSHYSSSSRRSTSSSRHASRGRSRSIDTSQVSSRGRPRTTSRDPSTSRRRSSSQSSRRSSSQSTRRSTSASRASSRGRSHSNSRPSVSSSPRDAYGLSRQDTGQVGHGGSRYNSSTPRSSSSRGRGERNGRSAESIASSRKSSTSKSKIGLRGNSNKSTASPRSVSSGSRSSGRRSRTDKSSRSQPLLDDSDRNMDETRGPQDIELVAIQSDLEYGTVGDQFTVTSGYPGASKTSTLANPEQMVNGLLIQLKFESEVCPWPLRLLLVLTALGMLATSILPYILHYSLSVADVIISTLTTVLSILIILLEGRFSFVNSDPVGCRASVRGTIVKNVGGLKLVWGRGVLYVVAGLLQVAQMHTITYITGGLMALVGLVVIVAGASSAAQLMRLKKSLTDDAHLLYLFAKYDNDKDGYQVIKDFARFIVSVGLDLDDAYTIGAFKAIDKDYDGKISFIDFHKWWAQCTVRGNHVFRMKEQEINNFSNGAGSW